VYVFNDHITSFFFDNYGVFSLGIGEEYKVADEGGGARALPPVAGNPELAAHIGASLIAEEFDMSFFQDKPLDHGFYKVADEGGGARALPAVPGHPELAAHIGASLIAEEFDMSFFQDKPLDHGFFSPMSVLLERTADQWPTTLVPLQVGVIQFPIPSAARCYKLGQALRRAIESYPEDIDVAVLATGGLSHQVHGERSGHNNVEWDRQFLELIARDPARLTEMTVAEYAELGGWEGAEIVMWLIMRGALSANVRVSHSSYYLPSMTAIATLVLDNDDLPVPGKVNERQRARIVEQTADAARLPGTHPFTLLKSARRYRINKFLHDLVIPEHRELFKRDPEAAFAKAGLTEQERDLIRRRDWQGLIHYGAIFFVLEKLGAVVGVSNLHIYAAMRGEKLEDFLKTRNTQVLYSVTGTEAGRNVSWDKKSGS